MKKIRVLVVDDQTVVREGLAAILANYPDIEVIGHCHQTAIRAECQTRNIAIVSGNF